MQDRNYNLNPFGQQQSASQQQQRPQQMQQDQQQHRPQQQQPMQQDPQQQQQYGSQTQSYAPQQQQVYGQPQPHLQQQHTQPAFQQQQWQQQPSQQQQQRPAQQYEPQPGYGSTPNSMYNGGTPELGAYGTHPQPPSHLMPTPTPTPPFSSSPYGTAEALPALVASAASPPPPAHGAAVAAAIGVGGGDGPSRVVILVEATLALKPTWADLRGLYLEPLLIAMENQQQLQQQQQQQQQQQVTPEIALIVFRGCSSMPCEGLFESSGWVDSIAEVSGSVGRGEVHSGRCDATRPQKAGCHLHPHTYSPTFLTSRLSYSHLNRHLQIRHMLDNLVFSGWAEKDTALAHAMHEAMYLQSLPSPISPAPTQQQHGGGGGGGGGGVPLCHCLLISSANEYNRMWVFRPCARPGTGGGGGDVRPRRPDQAWGVPDTVACMKVWTKGQRGHRRETGGGRALRSAWVSE